MNTSAAFFVIRVVEFWKKFWREFKNNSIREGFLSLFGVLSFFPILAIFPPICSWDRKYKPENWRRAFSYVPYIITVLIFTVILGWFLYLTLDIYLRFIIFTITALIFHYQVTIVLISLIGGSIGFMISQYSEVMNVILKDKLFIQHLWIKTLDIGRSVSQAVS